MDRRQSTGTSREPHTLERLEARTVLSLVYYDSAATADLPGFPGGDPGRLAGTSENGRFLWSERAARETGDDSPAFLVIDGEYRSIDEFPDLADAFVADINSHGMVLASDRHDREIFVYDLSDGTRTRLDSLISEAPQGFVPGAVEPLEIADDGIIVLAHNFDDADANSVVWGLLDGVVEKLWRSENNTTRVYSAAGNIVVGTRFTAFHKHENPPPESDAVRWTPAGGLRIIDILDQARGTNARGEVVGIRNGTPWDFAVVWHGSDYTDLPPGPIRERGVPLEIDDAGRVLLSVDLGTISPSYHAYIYDGVGMVSMSERGGSSPDPVTMADNGLVLVQRGTNSPIAPHPIVHANSDSTAIVVDDQGRVSVAYVNERGHVGTIVKHLGEVDFGEWNRGVTAEELPLDGYAGGRDGRTYFAVDSILTDLDEQLTRLDYLQGRTWGWAGEVRSLAAFLSPFGRAQVAALHENGHLVFGFEKFFDGPFGGNVWGWKSVDLTEKDLAPRGIATPDFAGEIDAFETAWRGKNIVGVDVDGDLWAVWTSPARAGKGWAVSNLSELSGAPRLVGNVAASSTPWGAMQIFGTDERGHVIAVWWSSGTNRWQATDLTALVGGESLEAGSLAGAATRWGAIEVVGRTAESEVATYWWAVGSGGWTYESITATQVGTTPRVVGPLSLHVGRDGSQHIAGVSAEGELIHLYWLPDRFDLWRAENLTELALG